MKQKEKQTLKGKSPAELITLVQKEKDSFMKTHLTSGEQKDTHVLRKKRQNIARMLTFIRIHELENN